MRKWLLPLKVVWIVTAVMTAGTVVATIVETMAWEWPYPSITQMETDIRIETITAVVCIVSAVVSIIVSVIFALKSDWDPYGLF